MTEKEVQKTRDALASFLVTHLRKTGEPASGKRAELLQAGVRYAVQALHVPAVQAESIARKAASRAIGRYGAERNRKPSASPWIKSGGISASYFSRVAGDFFRTTASWNLDKPNNSRYLRRAREVSIKLS